MFTRKADNNKYIVLIKEVKQEESDYINFEKIVFTEKILL